MSALARKTEEPNNDEGDTVIGGKDQLQLNEGTRTFLPLPLDDLHSATAGSIHSQLCFPRNGNFLWLDDLLLFALEHVCLCTCVHIDV